jgi:hypothetical protein
VRAGNDVTNNNDNDITNNNVTNNNDVTDNDVTNNPNVAANCSACCKYNFQGIPTEYP